MESKTKTMAGTGCDGHREDQAFGSFPRPGASPAGAVRRSVRRGSGGSELPQLRSPTARVPVRRAAGGSDGHTHSSGAVHTSQGGEAILGYGSTAAAVLEENHQIGWEGVSRLVFVSIFS